jgi:GTPase
MPSIYFPIDGVYEVKGVGVILGGTVMHGSIKTGDTLYLGPDRVGAFIQVQIKSIECRRQSLIGSTPVLRGQSATMAVKPLAAYRKQLPVLKKSWVRKGMVLVDGYALPGPVPGPSVGPLQPPKAVREFEASVVILHHSTTISPHYQAVVHCGVVRQAAEIVSIKNANNGSTPRMTSTATASADSASASEETQSPKQQQGEVLRTGERALVRFRFLYFAEYILPGATFIFREGKAKGIGKIVKTYPIQPLSIG